MSFISWEGLHYLDNLKFLNVSKQSIRTRYLQTTDLPLDIYEKPDNINKRFTLPNDLRTYRIFQNDFNPVSSGMISTKAIKTHRRNFNFPLLVSS